MPGHDWPGHNNAAPEPIDDRAPRRHRELIAALEWLPVAALILADDGTVLASNRAWDDLVGRSSVTSGDPWRRGDWLSAVGPADVEELRARLQAAASDGGTGSADVRLTGASRTRWSRWWWRAGPTGYLVVCAGDCGPWTGDAEDITGTLGMTGTLGLVVHRLFGIGLELQAVSSRTDDFMAQRLQHTLGELDDLIRDIRSAALGLGRPLHHR